MPSPNERREILGQLNLLAAQDLSDLWRDASMLDLDSTAFRSVMVQAVPELVAPYATTAADLSALWYEDSAPELAYRAIVAPPAPVEQLAASTRWALGASGQAALAKMIGTAQRTVFNASRDTIVGNIRLEPGSRWARHASSTACAFCRLMATRGAVYSTEGAAGLVGAERWEAKRNYKGQKVGGDIGRAGRVRGTQQAGSKYHDHCHCLAVEVRPGQSYQPPPYVEKWEQQYIDAVRGTDGKGEFGAIDINAVVSHMRAAEIATRPAKAPAARAAAGGGGKPPIKPPTGGQSVQGAGDDKERRRLEHQLDQIMKARIRKDIPLADVEAALAELQAYRVAHGITGVLDTRIGPGFDEAEMVIVRRLLDEKRNVTSIPKKKSGEKTPDMGVDGVLAEIKSSSGRNAGAFLDRLEAGAAQSPRIYVNATESLIPVEKLEAGVKDLVDRGVLTYARIIGNGVDVSFGRW